MDPLSRFHHVALTVSDLDTSVDWYRRVLGMIELIRDEGRGRRAVVCGFASGGVSVGLVEHRRVAPSRFDPTAMGLDHLAFSVSSHEGLQEWANHLATNGVAHSEPIVAPPAEILNFKDPDGIALALVFERG